MDHVEVFDQIQLLFKMAHRTDKNVKYNVEAKCESAHLADEVKNARRVLNG